MIDSGGHQGRGHQGRANNVHCCCIPCSHEGRSQTHQVRTQNLQQTKPSETQTDRQGCVLLVYVLPKQAQACVLTWEGGEDSRHSQTDTISSKNQCVHTFLISSFLKIHFLQHKKSPVFFFLKNNGRGLSPTELITYCDYPVIEIQLLT